MAERGYWPTPGLIPWPTASRGVSANQRRKPQPTPGVQSEGRRSRPRKCANFVNFDSNSNSEYSDVLKIQITNEIKKTLAMFVAV